MLAEVILAAFIGTSGPEHRSDAPEPARAEFAVRWDPSEGGVPNARAVLDFLGAPGMTGEVYEVRYFDLPRPDGAPADSTVILRQRRKVGGKAELRLKYRRDRPLAGPWQCPAGRPYEKKKEVDVSVAGPGDSSRVYSYSCDLTGEQPPPSLSASPKSCNSRVVRYAFGGLKIEEWTLPGGNKQLEVSRSAPNDGEELRRFEHLVSRLREKGVRPSSRSKTELGSQCPQEPPPAQADP
jgi:hypothetical protein